MGIACFAALILCYMIGTIFMMLYLNISIEKALLLAVVPYLPFDIVKIIISVLVVSLLPSKYRY